jgi:hypothetical protein
LFRGPVRSQPFLILDLHWWTLHRPVGTKDAAVARLGAQHCLAADALVEKLASVSWHRLALSEATNGAHQQRFQKNVDHISGPGVGIAFRKSSLLWGALVIIDDQFGYVEKQPLSLPNEERAQASEKEQSQRKRRGAALLQSLAYRPDESQQTSL